MEHWIYFIHAPRERFADTMTAGIARGELRPFRAAFLRGAS